MPTSSDPQLRANQLANLLKGSESPGTWQPGDAPQLEHGARSRRPQASPEWSPSLSLTILDLEDRVDASLRDDAGELLPWALPSVEAVAIQRVACVRIDRYVAGREAKGQLKPEDLDLQSKIGERYHRSLEREAMTLRSRLDATAGATDLATALAALARLADAEAEAGAAPTDADADTDAVEEPVDG